MYPKLTDKSFLKKKPDEYLFSPYKNGIRDSVKINDSAIAVCEKNNNKFCSPVNFNFKDIFNNIYRIDDNYEWIDNIYCIDVLYKF